MVFNRRVAFSACIQSGNAVYEFPKPGEPG